MEWYEDVPPRHEYAVLTNETVHTNHKDGHTYEMRGRSGRWYIVRFRTELGEEAGSTRTKFFPNQKAALEIFGDLST